MSTNIAMSVFLDWERTTRDTIDLKRIYVDMAGDLVAGLVLSQIVYWSLPDKNGQTKLRVRKDGRLWIAKQRDEWWDECRVTPKQLDRALSVLLERRLIHKDVTLFNNLRTVIVRLNDDPPPPEYDSILADECQPYNFVSTWLAFSSNRGEYRNSPKVNYGIDQTGRPCSPKVNTLNRDYTEITSESIAIGDGDELPSVGDSNESPQSGNSPDEDFELSTKVNCKSKSGTSVRKVTKGHGHGTKVNQIPEPNLPDAPPGNYDVELPDEECESAWGVDLETADATCAEEVSSLTAGYQDESESTSPVVTEKVTAKAIRSVVLAYQEAVGSPLAKSTWSKECRFAKEMLEVGYTRDEIISCYRFMKNDDTFWRGKDVSLSNVIGKIANWKARQSRVAPPGPIAKQEVALPDGYHRAADGWVTTPDGHRYRITKAEPVVWDT